MGKIIYDADKILGEWRTGEYTQRDLAYRHKVSASLVNQIVKGEPKSAVNTINKMVEAKQELATMDIQTVNAVNAVVDERVKHIQFFDNAAIINIQRAMKLKLDKVGAHKILADTINTARESVLGKQPTTAVQINNSAGSTTNLTTLSAEDASRAYQKFISGT